MSEEKNINTAPAESTELNAEELGGVSGGSYLVIVNAPTGHPGAGDGGAGGNIRDSELKAL